jgi:hypothetical protein
MRAATMIRSSVRHAAAVAALLLAPWAAAAQEPLAPLPPRGTMETVGVRMGDVTFLVPKDLYAMPTSPRAERQFALILPLVPLAGAAKDDPQDLTVSVLHDPSGRLRREQQRELAEFADGATMRADEDGFFHYPNATGERIETHDAQGQLFALQCSTDAEPACRRDAIYAPTILLTYRYPRPYLRHALEIEAAVFHVLDSLTRKPGPTAQP